MFKRATKKLVQQIDPEGALIAASSPNDSKNLQPLAVVLKIPKSWFWQQTKYRPTPFTLKHLLNGEAIEPVCNEKEFGRFKGIYMKDIEESIEVDASAFNIKVNGQGKSKLCLSLGKLQMEYVDIPTLMNDSKGRKLDLTHPLIQQSLKRNKGFTLLKERIFTTCNCSIFYTELGKGGCNASIGQSCFELPCMETSGKLQYDSETALDIPPDTVIAYSVTEMTIESDGYFDLCVTSSGLEADDTSRNPSPFLSEVDGQRPLIKEGFPLHTLKNALADVQTSFCALDDLSTESRSSILLLLRKILLDRSVLSALSDMLSSDETPCFLTSELSENQSKIISAFLDLLKCEPLDKNGLSSSTPLSSYNGCQISTANHSDLSLASELNGSGHKPEEQNGHHTAVSHQNGCSTKASKQSMKVTHAIQMLVNALEELTDAVLNLLEPFCTSESLKTLQDLVIHLTSDCKPLCKDTIPVFLQSDDEYHRLEALFKSCNVLLRKENDTLTSEMTCREGFLPMVLCIAIHGLASLSDA